MRCANCSTENPEGAKFCSECGSPMTAKCPRCGASYKAGAKFCNECGASVGEAAASRAQAAAPAAAKGAEPREAVATSAAAHAGGERRHLTVLFCDLVGSTEISSRLDPEEWREIVASYHRAAAEAIERFGGHVAKYLGDGVMAFFGYPQAHDNDAERAARGGLAILEAVGRLEAPVKLSARVGIDSGPVVVGAGAGKEADVFGDTPNIAARVQAAAEPGMLLITADTHRLVSGLFVVEDRGEQGLKGVESSLRLYRVVRPSGMRGRLEAAAARGLTPFVGREDELRLLMNRWERAREGEGQVVMVIGEAGIGKSRLVQQFREQIASDPHTWLEGATAAFSQNTPFYAVADMLRQSFHWGAGDTAERRLHSLEASLALAGVKVNEAAPLVASLLDVPAGAKYPPSSMTPEQQRKQLLATLVAWTFGVARVQPLVIATEDLHWADPSTLELTQLLVEQGAMAPLLLVYTARPEFRAQWPLRAHHTQITLNRLSTRNVRAMIARVAASKALTGETVDAMIERTGGVPLFVEELTRAVLEAGGSLAGRAIPTTLHDSLMARLDRLGAAKEIAQIGAVIGSEFSYQLLRAVNPVADSDLEQRLQALVDAELVYVRGIAPDATYQFKHALIRDAAYEALLKSRRKELHRTVGRTIDEQFPAIKESHPEALARHWAEAGESELAIAAWQLAGDRAVEQRAYHEAERHYRDALAMLIALPESVERDSRELILQLALAAVLVATMGWGAVATANAYERAKALTGRAPFSEESLKAVSGLWAAAISRCELRTALSLADQMLEIAFGVGRTRTLVEAHFAQGLTHGSLGDLTEARQHYLKVIEHYREDDFRGVPDDWGILARGQIATNEWVLGFPEQARLYTEDARALARRLNKPFGVAFGYSFGALTDGLRGDVARCLPPQESERSTAGLAFPVLDSVAKIHVAWARAQMGELAGAIDAIREGLAELEATRFSWGRGLFLSLLAKTQALAGAVDEALITIEEALQVNPQELIFRPNTLTCRGELRLTQGRVEQAVSDFHEAIAIAQKIDAKSWELRATTSLARLLASQGKRDEVCTILAEIYGWFTEGFDTADLIDAKALLEELRE